MLINKNVSYWNNNKLKFLNTTTNYDLRSKIRINSFYLSLISQSVKYLKIKFYFSKISI